MLRLVAFLTTESTLDLLATPHQLSSFTEKANYLSQNPRL